MTLNDIYTIESDLDSTEEDYYLSLQRAINSGLGWRLQGGYGRSMMEAIDSGRCLLGEEPHFDYYGSRIPSRHEVKEGTKGSYQFVVENSGSDWADSVANA